MNTISRLSNCLLAVMAASLSINASGFEVVKQPEGLAILKEGRLWLRTVPPSFDPSRRDATYKVYTEVWNPEGSAPLTKGEGGKFPHHRGLFIGWKNTTAAVSGDVISCDTWHMTGCIQEQGRWLEMVGGDKARQSGEVLWKAEDGRTFILENRTITVHEASASKRVIDFTSQLNAVEGKVILKGDSHHAGMQMRLSDEVSKHEETTEYILPEGAERMKNDEVKGAWWVCCSAELDGKRRWFLHMTPPSHLAGPPVYSIRPYARFGAFWETEIASGVPASYRFRIVCSETELTPAACAALYAGYATESAP